MGSSIFIDCSRVRGRFLRIIQFLLAAFILRNYFTFGIFEATHLICSWLTLFIRGDAVWSLNSILFQKKKLDSALSVYIIGIHFGLIFLYVGLDKVIDPLWFYGSGFHSFISLPWVLPENLKFIGDYKWLMIVMNYGGVIAEVGFLPLFVFRKTRFYGISLALLLFMALVYPFNIFLIGPLAVTLAFAMYSICDKPYNFTYKTKDLKVINIKKTLYWISYSYIALLVFSFCFLFIKMNFIVNNFEERKLKAVSVLEPFERISELNSIHFLEHETWTHELWYDLNVKDILSAKFLFKRFLGVQQYGLFSRRHFLGIFSYRVTFTLEDGSIIEPIVYMTSDGYRGARMAEWFNINAMQGAIYGFSDISTNIAHKLDDKRKRKKVENILFIPFIQFAFQHLTVQQQNRVLHASFKVHEMPIAVRFKKRNTFYKEFELLRFFPKTGKIQYQEIPHPPLYTGRNPAHQSYMKGLLE